MPRRAAPVGHGSMPRADSAVVKLARAVERIGRTPLPLHAPAATRAFLEAAAGTQPRMRRMALRGLLDPRLGPACCGTCPTARWRAASTPSSRTPPRPRMLRAGDKINVIPGEAVAEIDARTLPGPDGERLPRGAARGGRTGRGAGGAAAASRGGVPAWHAALRRAGGGPARPIPRVSRCRTWCPVSPTPLPFSKNGTLYHGFAPVGLPAGSGPQVRGALPRTGRAHPRGGISASACGCCSTPCTAICA